jgi:hypothetical protein
MYPRQIGQAAERPERMDGGNSGSDTGMVGIISEFFCFEKRTNPLPAKKPALAGFFTA